MATHFEKLKNSINFVVDGAAASSLSSISSPTVPTYLCGCVLYFTHLFFFPHLVFIGLVSPALFPSDCSQSAQFVFLLIHLILLTEFPPPSSPPALHSLITLVII